MNAIVTTTVIIFIVMVYLNNKIIERIEQSRYFELIFAYVLPIFLPPEINIFLWNPVIYLLTLLFILSATCAMVIRVIFLWLKW